MGKNKKVEPKKDKVDTGAEDYVGDKKEFDPSFSGPRGIKRKPRDVPCVIIFLIFWIGMLGVGFLGVNIGDPTKLIYGFDSNEVMCGVGTTTLFGCPSGTTQDMTPFKNLYWPNPSDINTRYCVSKCPTALLETVYYGPDNNTLINGIPGGTSEVLYKCVPKLLAELDSRTDTGNDTITLGDLLDNPGKVVEYFLGQAYEHWPVIAVSAGVALVVAFVWLIFLWLFAAVIVWITIVGIILGSIAFTVLMYIKGGVIDATELTSALNTGLNYIIGVANSASIFLTQGQLTNITAGNASIASEISALNDVMDSVPIDAKTAEILAYVFTAVSIILLILFCALIKRILIAVQIIREATKAMFRVVSMIFFPIITYTWVIIFAAYGLAILIFLGSSGSFNPFTLSFDDVKSEDLCLFLRLLGYAESLLNSTVGVQANLTSVNFTIPGPVMNTLMVYHLFGFIWTFELVRAISFLSIAGSVSVWYFSRNKKDVSRFEVFASYNRALRYHLGSAAFGSFLIAVIQIIRILFNVMMNRLKKAKDHPVVKFLWVAINCCLKCLKRFIDFLNKQSYIQVRQV
uniref:Choline transporter-like protein n=1 Tax=Palpitomonas bilix TaxID=652834 RepID=A0A7S3DJM6_9EUKA